MTDLSVVGFEQMRARASIRNLAKEIVKARDPGINLRPAEVTAYQTAVSPFTMSVKVEGSAMAIDDVQFISSYFPTVGDIVWLYQNGPDLFGIGKLENGPSPWHTVGGAGEPGYQNGWVNYAAGIDGAAFKRIGETVFLKGTVKNGGASTVIFLLPSGFRPSPHYYAPRDWINNVWYVDTSGGVVFSSGSNTLLSLVASYPAQI